MLVLYKNRKKYNEFHLTKNKMDLNTRKWSKYNNNKQNMIFYKKWKKYYEIQLSKNKMDLNIQKIYHPPSPDHRE